MNSKRLILIGGVAFVVAVLAAGGAAGSELTTVTVSVVDQEDEPVGGVDVVATWETDGETQTVTGTTASNGRTFIDVPEGATVQFDVDDDTYIRNRPLSVEDASESEIEVAVSPSGTATVSVTDNRDRPQADTRVRIRDRGGTVDRGQTDESGTFTSSRLEQGSYTLRVVKPGFFEVTQEVTVTDETDATVTIERGSVTLDIRVFDDHFDPPEEIETGAIQVRSSAYEGEVTITEGSASLTVPVNAEYTAEVIKEGYDPSPETISIEESDVSTNVTAQRTRTLTASAANARVLVGETTRVTVRNAYDERVEGATIEVDGTAVGETDARGEFAVPIDATGELTIVATDGDVASEPITIIGVADEEEINESDDANETDDTNETDDGAPGFGAAVAVVALLGALAVAVRRGSGSA